MSYLVLARKWRPSTFDEVVGQGHVTRTLKNAIELGRVAHALLFTGSRGVGKTSCARILAKALNCQHGPTTTPCGKCPACTEIGNGTSVDVFEIDGASNNSVEQIREIRESVKFLPTRGKRKMYIIDEVHMLSTSAFNALLKTLEEPPEHVLFVFATTEPHKIPDTIISRCQRYDFKRIPEREIVDAIGGIAAAEGVIVEQAALHHIAREARGGMRDSLSLLDQVIAFCGTTISEAQTREVLGIADRQVLHHLTAAVFDGDGQRALEIIDHLFRFGLDLQKFAAEFVQHLRDLMVVKVCADPERLVDVATEEVAAMVALVQPVDPARIHRVFNALLQGADEVARSPFPKLVLEMTLLRLCHQGATLPLAEVLGGLARLEARLGDAVTPDGPGPARGGFDPGAGPPRGGFDPGAGPARGGFGPGAGPARGGFDPGAGPAFAGSSAAGGPAGQSGFGARAGLVGAAAPASAPGFAAGPDPAAAPARPGGFASAPNPTGPAAPGPSFANAATAATASTASAPSAAATSDRFAPGAAATATTHSFAASAPSSDRFPAAAPPHSFAASAPATAPAPAPAHPFAPAAPAAAPAAPNRAPEPPRRAEPAPPPRPPAPAAPAARPRTEERRTFKRRVEAEPGTVDDFSAPPPAPRPIHELPHLEVKPRLPGVQPGEAPPGEATPAPAARAPAATATAATATAATANTAPAATANTAPAATATAAPTLAAPPARMSAAPPVDADAHDEPEAPVVRPIDLDDADDDMDVFAQLVDALRQHHALGAGRIEHDAYLVSLDHEGLVLGVLAADFDALLPDLDRLRRVAWAAVGHGFPVHAQRLDRHDPRLDDTRNLYRRRTRRDAAERRARCEAARRDPMVMLISEALDAPVIEINPN